MTNEPIVLPWTLWGEPWAEGGMGEVYLAEHPRIGRRVAIKVLHPEARRTPEAVARFLVEARASSEIRSEHVIDILDFGELEPGEPYLTMEWLEGMSPEQASGAGGMDHHCDPIFRDFRGSYRFWGCG
ncbi:MAG: hypothetical protein H7X95_05080 [Deltaproteobacteria bacterium]|nr:hypothetical protein [Deltaproteobacteria bacterium]